MIEGNSYRVSAEALLRLAAIAASAPGGDPTEIIGILQTAELGEVENHLDFEEHQAEGGPIAPAKPEE